MYPFHGADPEDMHSTPPLQLTATFAPGDQDAYYMPVVSPMPQRSMPEVPEQIQQNLSKLELNSGPMPDFSQGGRQAASGTPNQDVDRLRGLSPRRTPAASPGVSPRASPGVSPSSRPLTGSNMPQQSALTPEPFFPYIKNRPPNVPARAEETEQILESARMAVLTSTDPEMQVTWAQDALAYIDTALENNSRLAEAGMGRSTTPPIERQLKSDAFNVLSFLADQHHPKAEFLRGTWLEFGKFGCPLDKPAAYRAFSTSARNGYARAEYRLGMQFEETGENDKALQHYHRGVQAHDAASYYRMGMMYLLGQKGQPRDIKLGLEYIRYSADNADENAPQGAYVYGMLFARELPQVTIADHELAQNISSAKYYLEKAAYLGFSKAQTRMGAAYELQQLGCDFDPVYSLHYNRLAARQGEPEAEMAISKWFLSGYEGVFPKNEAVAYEYALRAAKSEFAIAEFAMGYFNEVGIHVPVNLVDAKYWYGLAAEHGNEDAKGRITGISRSKTLSRKDHDRVALAKIQSIRGRPKNESQPPVQMPQIESYRQPSPAPSAVSSLTMGSERSSHQGIQHGRPSPQPYTSPSLSPAPFGAPSLSPMSHSASSPNLSPAASSPYSSRQSSLPQGYRTSSMGMPGNHVPGHQSPYPMGSPNLNVPGKYPSPGVADFGYSAPPDLSGADRRRIVSGPGPYGNQGASTPPAGMVNRKPTPSSQGLPMGSNPGRTNALQMYPHAKPGSAYPTPPPTSGTPQGPYPPRTNIPPQGGPKPQQAQSQAASRPPGKGPATFAEMGIPQAKQESDCVVM